MDFKTDAERQQWITTNATYFTVVRFRGVGKYERHERATLQAAEETAHLLAHNDKGSRWLIYAVAPICGHDSDTLVKVVAS